MIFIQKVSILKFENLGKMLFPFLYPQQKKQTNNYNDISSKNIQVKFKAFFK